MKLKITQDVASGLKVCRITDSTTGEPIIVSTAPFTDAQKQGLPKKIRVVLEATHTGINDNLVEYTHDGLASSKDSWTRDYNKPVLLNHNSYSDPLGRVLDAQYKQSILDESKYCIQLELEITNEAAIERFLDGRYKTFSIGGYTDSAKCSICGKEQMDAGWCGHQRGRTYDGKTCYWTLGVMDYVEVSIVNCPADRKAQAISFIDENGNEIPMPGQTTEPNTSEDSSGSPDIIDSILGNLSNPKFTDGAGASPTENQDGDTTQQDNAPKGTDDPTPKSEPQTDEKDARIKELEDQLVQKDAEITTLTGKLATSEQALEDANTQLTASKLENDGLVKQNITLAKYTHKTLCENLADMQIIVGEKKSEQKDSLIAEYATYTSKKITDSIKELVSKERAPRSVPTVAHPGTGQSQCDGTTQDSTTNTKAPTALEELNKLADTMQGFLAGRNRCL